MSSTSASNDVTISEPPGLGDKQPFVLHSSKKPITVKLAFGGGLKPAKVVLWDVDQRLAEKTEGPWTFEVSLKPGIHALIDDGNHTRLQFYASEHPRVQFTPKLTIEWAK